MPVILTLFGLRFYFYSNDHSLVHVKGSGGEAKIEIGTGKIVYNHGLSVRELRQATKVVGLYEDEIVAAWYAYFGTK